MRSFASASEARRRLLAAAVIAALTAAAALAGVSQRQRLAASVQLLPADDPVARIDRAITADFGLQNPLVWVIAARRGSVWQAPVLAHVQALTREVFTIPGVLAPTVMSLASPNVRDLRVSDDALEPVYLMASVPRTREDIAALRRRVEGNPNYNGTFVSLDGRAAMVVADFRLDGGSRALGRAALALRDRHRDVETAVYAAGAPLLAETVPRHLVPTAAAMLAILLGAGVALTVLGGPRVALASLLAALAAGVWATAALLVLDRLLVPWAAYALAPAAILAAALAGGGWTGSCRTLVAGLLAGLLAGSLIAIPPVRAFAVAGAIGALAASLAAPAARALVGLREVSNSTPGRWIRAWGATAGVLVLLAVPGIARLHGSFSSFGYGARYLPDAAAEDLRAVGEHFPPPAALAVRLRGEPGFVKSPAVLEALDAVTTAVRPDPSVVRALSLADLVKMVHSAFNGNRPGFDVIPADPGLVGRYLALAYSPGFRTFVDRAFSKSVLWTYVASDDPRDLRRVRDTMAHQLAAHPAPAAQVDVIAGDGALALRLADEVRSLAIVVFVAWMIAVAAVGFQAGPAAGLDALVSGAAATVLAFGALGWRGVPIDLLSLACVAAAPFTATVLAVTAARPLAVSLGVAGALCLCLSIAAGSALAFVAGTLFLAPALGASVPRLRPLRQEAKAPKVAVGSRFPGWQKS